MTRQELEESVAKLEAALAQQNERLDTMTSDVQGLAVDYYRLAGAKREHEKRMDRIDGDITNLDRALAQEMKEAGEGFMEHETRLNELVRRLDKQTLRIASLELWRDDAATAAADIGDIERRVGEAEQVAATAQRMAIAVDSAMTAHRADTRRWQDAHAGRIAELEKAKIVAQAATAQAPAKKPLPDQAAKAVAVLRNEGWPATAASLEEFIRKELGL